MAVNDVYEVRIEGLLNSGRRWNVVHHFGLENEAVPDQLFQKSLDLAELVYAEWQAGFSANFADDTFLTSVRATRIYPEKGVPAVARQDSALQGGEVGGSYPGDVAIVCTQRTEKAGRSFLGRSYMPPPPEGFASLDQIETAFQPQLSTYFTTLCLGGYTDQAGNQWVQVVYSPKLAEGGVLPGNEVAATVVVMEMDITLRNQTRRGRRERVPVIGTPTP